MSVQGVAGLHSFGETSARWWLHLYVMLVWVSCVRNMLLLSPPLRELLEKGLPPSVREVLRMFAEKIIDSTRMAASWASWVCIAVACVLENVLMSTMLMFVVWPVYSAAMIHNDERGGERQS